MRHVILRVPKRDHNFDNHPHTPITCRQPPPEMGEQNSPGCHYVCARGVAPDVPPPEVRALYAHGPKPEVLGV